MSYQWAISRDFRQSSTPGANSTPPSSKQAWSFAVLRVTGERARELLFLYGEKGEFIVRPSESNPSDHTLSVQ